MAVDDPLWFRNLNGPLLTSYSLLVVDPNLCFLQRSIKYSSGIGSVSVSSFCGA
jgi:hypothetical protein